MSSANRVIAGFSLRRVVGLLNGAAYAGAAYRHSALSFERFSENAVMNTVIAAITGQTGFAAVKQDIETIEVDRRSTFTSSIHSACVAIDSGPAAFVNYLAWLQKDRDSNLRKVQELFQQARNIDEHIAGNLQTAIRACAAVQFGSTIILAATPVGLTFAGASSAFGAGMVGFGYSVTKDLVKDIADAKHANIVAFDLEKDVAKKIGDLRSDQLAEKAAHKIVHETSAIGEAEAKIMELSRSAARKISSRKLAKLDRQIGRNQKVADEATHTIRLAKYGKIACRSLQVVFALHDIYEGFDDFERAWGGHHSAGSR